MSLKEETLQSQLQRAQAHLSEVEKTVGQGVPKKNAMWRQANARVRQIESRLNARTNKGQSAGEAASEEE